jgi:tetratricopeptide (TPR) repeat protein
MCFPSRHLRTGVCLVLLACGPPAPAAATNDGQSAVVPPLSTLDLDTFPPATREALTAPYHRAVQRAGDHEAVGRLALVLHAWDQLDAAAEVYARAQALAPGEVDWWYLGGLLATRRALPSEAVEQFERAKALAPADPLVALRLADAWLDHGELDAAFALYEVLTTRPETAPAASYGVGRILQTRGDADGARAAYEQALAIYPDFGAAHYALAQLQRRAGDLDAARASLARQQQCLACWPMPPDPWRERLDAVRDDARVLLQRGTSHAADESESAAAEAIRLHEAALERDPTLGQAHVNLIGLYGRTGNAVRAEAHYRAAREMPGFAADAHRAWGWARIAEQQPEEAAGAFREALGLQPGDASALQGLGLALEMTGQPADAVTAYVRALEADPTARNARFSLARALVQLGRFPEAIAELERLRTPEDAETPRFLFALGVAYVRAGDLARGRATSEQALALAQRLGQRDFAGIIEAELAKLPR